MDFSSKSNLQCVENRWLSNIDEWLPHVNIYGCVIQLSEMQTLECLKGVSWDQSCFLYL